MPKLFKSMAVALGALFGSSAAAVSPAPENGACSLENAAPATVAAIDDDFDLLLDDGRRAALSGVEFAPPLVAKGSVATQDLRAAAHARLSAWLTGRDVFIGAFAATPDRWGRAPVQAYAAAGDDRAAPLVSISATLLEEGLARFRPDPPAAPCVELYRSAEAAARAASRGQWAEPAARPIKAGGEGAAALLQQRKGMVIFEGEITSFGESKAAVYLNFGQKRAQNASIVVLRRNLATLQASGIDPRKLVGRWVRVRGLFETAFGPRIEISSPAEIEILDTNPP